jgi:putative tricarboxylic transport membrane protein
MAEAARRRLAGETFFVIAMVMLSVFLLWTAYKISGFKSLSSAGAYPMAATLTMVVTAVIALLGTLKSAPTDALEGETDAGRFLREVTPPAIVGFTLAIVAYMFALEYLGFVLSSFVFLLVSMRLLGGTDWKMNLLAAVVTIAGIYVIFQTAFSVILPKGTILQGLAAGTPFARWLP